LSIDAIFTEETSLSLHATDHVIRGRKSIVIDG